MLFRFYIYFLLLKLSCIRSQSAKEALKQRPKLTCTQTHARRVKGRKYDEKTEKIWCDEEKRYGCEDVVYYFACMVYSVGALVAFSAVSFLFHKSEFDIFVVVAGSVRNWQYGDNNKNFPSQHTHEDWKERNKKKKKRGGKNSDQTFNGCESRESERRCICCITASRHSFANSAHKRNCEIIFKRFC